MQSAYVLAGHVARSDSRSDDRRQIICWSLPRSWRQFPILVRQRWWISGWLVLETSSRFGPLSICDRYHLKMQTTTRVRSLSDAANHFFFSAFHTVREIARPQNGQKFIRYKLGRSSGERTA